MRTFFDKLILTTGSFLFQLYLYPQLGRTHVIALLSASTMICLFTILNPDLLPYGKLPKAAAFWETATVVLFFLISLVVPQFVPFLPLLFYELVQKSPLSLLAIPVLLFFFPIDGSVETLLLFECLFCFAFHLKSGTLRLLHLENDFKHLRDSSTEYNLLLKQKNKELIMRQDNEIRVATLKERNRIAREIHDNVGHLLSRSLLQSGALLAINKDERLKEPLLSLKDSLSLAMNSIRSSVHDLHDDSVDLKSSLDSLTQDFQNYKVTLDYDMETVIPKNIKYSFIAITKEALSNISRHSNATRIHISVHEHPSLYQLIIEDNGTDIKVNQNGLGLQNMKDRIDQLHGRFHFTTNQGFRIFISVPKTNK